MFYFSCFCLLVVSRLFMVSLAPCMNVSRIVKDGDYYVIGLFSMIEEQYEFDPDAMRLYLKLRYLMARQNCMLRRIKFGYVAYDVCNNSTSLTATLSALFLDRRYNVGGGEQTIFNRSVMTSSNILAVVSYMTPNLTELTARILSQENLPYFAYTDNNTNSGIYPNLISSFNLINDELVTMVDRISRRNFRCVATVNLLWGSSSFSRYHQLKLFNILTADKNLCVVEYRGFSDNNTMLKVIENIKEFGNIEIIYVWIQRQHLNIMLDLIDRYAVFDKTWYWYSDRNFVFTYPEISQNASEYMYYVLHPLYVYSQLINSFPYRRMRKAIPKDIYMEIISDPWIVRYAAQTQINLSTPAPFMVFDYRPLTMAQENIEVMLLSLWWLQPYKRIEKEKKSLRNVRNLTFLRSSSRVLHLSTSSNPFIDMENMEFAEPVSNQRRNGIRCNKPLCQAGFEPKQSVYNGDFWIQVFAWQCVSCAKGTFKSSFGNHTCIFCGIDLLPSADRTSCYDPYRTTFLDYTSDSLGIILVSVNAVGLIGSFVALIVFLVYRNTPVVRSSHLLSSTIQLVLYMLIFVANSLLFLQKPSKTSCMLQPLVIGFLFTSSTSITLIKTQQLLQALQADQLRTRSNPFVSEAVLFFLLFLLYFGQVSIAVTSLVLMQPGVDVVKHTTNYVREISCNTETHLDIQLCYVLLLSFYCTIQSFRARKVPKYFNDTTHSGCAMFLTIVLLCLKFAVMSRFDSPIVQTFITALILGVAILIRLFVVYAYKIYMVFLLSKRKTVSGFLPNLYDCNNSL